MQNKYIFFPILALLLVFPFRFAEAKTYVSINGISNGVALYAYKGPELLNKLAKVVKSGGSIAQAKARALFKKHTITIGNVVKSKGTQGDAESTHVRAGSLFFGKAKFKAAKKGQTVKNFPIVYHVDGDLKCYIPDEDVPEDYAIAYVETQVRFNNDDKFIGSALVDGRTGFDGGDGDLAGKFTEKDEYNVSIKKDFSVNLGNLKDGKTYPLLFFGATLVSYAADIPVDYCTADFYSTGEFGVSEKNKKSKGNFTFEPAVTVTATPDSQPWDRSDIPDITVYVESSNTTLINTIDVNQVQLFERLGDVGQIQPKSILDTGDFDGDGVSDRGIVFDGLQLYTILQLTTLGHKDNPLLYLIGETTSGTPFAGKFRFETQE